MSSNIPLVTRGRVFVGTVLSSKAQKTAVVEWEHKKFIHKFERNLRKRKRVKAHVPDGVELTKGDVVKIKECRPISKTKHFIVIGHLGKNVEFLATEEQREEAMQHRGDEE